MKILLENETWAKTFRDLRGKFTQQEASEILFGLPVRTQQEWEQGRRTPPEWIQYLVGGQLMRASIKAGQRAKAGGAPPK